MAGSLGVGAFFMHMVGRGMWKMFTHPEQLFYDSKRTKSPQLLKEDGKFVSPYRRISGFVVPAKVSAMDVSGGSIYIATSDSILVYGMSGELQTQYPVHEDVRDIALYADNVYVLFDTRVEVYDRQGEMLQHIDACSVNSNYCSLAVCGDGIFITDIANKNICKYNLDGTLAGFIQSPKGFVVPSFCFSITYVPATVPGGEGTICCVNPGRHLVETYSTDGEFLSSFGKAGAGKGAFSGCCNPAIITPANNGELLTSEKGIPRISCYSDKGRFRSVLLDSKALGGGNSAYDVKVMKDKLIVVGGDKVSVFMYDSRMSQNTKCGQCTKDCPLKIDK